VAAGNACSMTIECWGPAPMIYEAVCYHQGTAIDRFWLPLNPQTAGQCPNLNVPDDIFQAAVLACGDACNAEPNPAPPPPDLPPG
jgi:hypothetical protein